MSIVLLTRKLYIASNHLPHKCFGSFNDTYIIGSSILKHCNSMLQNLPAVNMFFGTKALLKTNQAAAKRLRLRGSGSIKRAKAGRQHNTGYKSRERCNNLGQLSGISEPGIEKRMRRAIGK